MSKKNKKLMCAVYLSVDAPDKEIQDKEEKQFRYIKDYCKGDGLKIVKSYHRAGLSRCEMQKHFVELARQIEVGELQAVVIANSRYISCGVYVYLEMVRCYFDIPQENLEKCRYTYHGNETYAFLMSDKYIMALYTHCLVARKEAAIQGMQIEGLTEKEYGMVRLENVGDVLFQSLLFDNVKYMNKKIYMEFYTLYLLLEN